MRGIVSDDVMIWRRMNANPCERGLARDGARRYLPASHQFKKRLGHR